MLIYHFADSSNDDAYSFNPGPSQRFIISPERVFTNVLTSSPNNEGPGSPTYNRVVAMAEQVLAPVKLTAVQRVRIRLLWELGWKYAAITRSMGCSIRQVNHCLIMTLWAASERNMGSPRRGPRARARRGRRPLLDTPKR